MRIGIDATCWTHERGYGRFTRELVTAMVRERSDHQFVCMLDGRSASAFGLSGPNVTTVVVRQATPPAVATAQGSPRSIRDMLRLTAAVRRTRVDAFLSLSIPAYFPLPPGLPAVATLHDTTVERSHTVKQRLLSRAAVRLALKQARLVLTVSDFAARDAVARLGVPPARMRVTLKGVSDIYRPTECPVEIRAAAERARLPPGARWLMYVGGFGAEKHVDLIVRAHAEIAARQSDRPLMLVLVGQHRAGCPSEVPGIRQVVKECGTEHLVRWVGLLPDGEVRHLHSGAVALVLVSSAEGFGLPAFEAARCGTPVIGTTESPLPQLLEGGGIFVAPGDAVALRLAIERLCTDEPLRAELGARARERAVALSWCHAARVALDALEEVGSAAEKQELSTHARS